MEFTEPQWLGLKRHADDRGLLFLSSPFSDDAVELLRRVGIGAWKVASGELSNRPLLDRIAATGLPVLLSTGMSPLAEIDGAVQQVKAHGSPLAVLQCTTAYPCPPENVGLNLLPFFREPIRLPGRPLRSLRHDLPGAGRGDTRRGADRSPRDAQSTRCSDPTCRRR